MNNEPIAYTPEATTDVFVHYFNAGDIDALIGAYYAPDGVLADKPGKPAEGEELRRALSVYFDLKGTMKATTRHAYVSGDTALLIIDWVVDYTDKDGKSAQYPGTSTDVVRKGDDGVWRCIIDNPHNIV